jgi:hypothetical protein
MKHSHSMFLMATLLLTATSAAAIELQPGEWQTTETGTEDGKPAAPEVEKECMSAEEARDATNVVKQMKDQMQKDAGQCQVFDVNQSGETVAFVMKCGDPKMMTFDISGTFTFVSATRYTGAMKSAVTMGGKVMTTDKKVEAVRLGDCKPAPAKKR